MEDFSSSSYAHWMEQLFPVLGDLPLWKITVPGSHDSGAYHLSNAIAPGGSAPDWVQMLLKIGDQVPLVGQDLDNFIFEVLRDWSLTQNLDIAGQLNLGARYFDLRPTFYQNDFYTYHGLVGPSFADILGQIKDFLGTVSRELVILDVSHFANFQNEQHAQFISLIQETIGDLLFGETGADLLATTLGQYVANGPRALLIYEDAYIVQHPQAGFWPALSLYNNYANTPDFSIMQADQLGKLQAHSGNAQEMFLLSWTLTPNNNTILEDVLKRIATFGQDRGSLYKLCQTANPKLASFVQKYGSQYKMNVLYTDFCETSGSTLLATSIDSFE